MTINILKKDHFPLKKAKVFIAKFSLTPHPTSAWGRIPPSLYVYAGEFYISDVMSAISEPILKH